MARLVLPITFTAKVKLFGLVDEKNTDDGSGSIIIPYLTQQVISMDNDRIAVAAAVECDKDFQAFVKDSEKQHELCIKGLGEILADHKMMVQSLKKFYGKSVHTLGDWGVTVVGNKIVYPKSRTELCAAIKTLIDYHNSLAPGTSPISAAFLAQNEIDLTVNLGKIPIIIEADAKFAKAAKDAETNSEKRDTLINPVMDHLRGIGSYLIGQYPKTPKTVGDWGYVVDNSPKGAKLITPKFGAGVTKILYQVVAGSIIQVTGIGSLTITKGKAGTGTPIVLNTGDHWQVAKGYSIMTVSNPSLTLTSSLEYMKN